MVMARRSLRNSSASGTPQRIAIAERQSSTKKAPPKSTPKRSQYFKNLSSAGAASDSDQLSEAESPTPSVADAESPGYEDEDASASDPTSDEEEDIHSDADDTPPPKRQRRNTTGKSAVTPVASKTTPGSGKKGHELWRPGVKTGLGPGTQVVIDKPKPRPAGKIPYKDDTIHPNTMLFLEELAENNDREWLKMHDPDYRTSWRDFTSFLEAMQPKLIDIDQTIPELPVKDIIFRIYRDIRFTSDPTPYKTHFSAAWSRTGRKGPYAAYYIQIKPGGGSFVGGGLWHPEAQPVALLRRDIDRAPSRLKDTLKSPGIRKEFLGGVIADDKKVVKAFVSQNSENALKTKPRDYDADHRDIDLLRLKNFTMGRRLRDDEVVGPNGINNIAQLLASLEPFITYLNSTVMPDDASSEADGTEEESDENNGDG